MIGQGELRTPHASRITPHASRITPHAAREHEQQLYVPPKGGHNKLDLYLHSLFAYRKLS